MTSFSDLLTDIPVGVDDSYDFDMIRVGYDKRGHAIVYLDNDPLPSFNPIDEE